ncbi:MAG TPA: cation diffusion facilitator family transporter [Microbacteriaceae bacterium]|nr:cation diffusion facilitator family transporter [Microbacteriaceae bacterium]
MSSSGGTRAIVAALAANLGIATTKFIAWAFSGSASMLAEGVHSLADSGNQILLMIGGRRSRRAANDAHPFGYGRDRFVYAFVVSIVLFSVGGIFSILEGIDKLQHPHDIEMAWLPLSVLGVAIVLESLSLRTAIREARAHKGGQSWVAYVRHAKAPELPVVLLEDCAALVGLFCAALGVGLSTLTGNAVWDALGTLAIGALLVLVALILGIETKSLLVGEGASASDREAISAAILDGPEVQRIIHMKTLHLGPDELLVATKLAFAANERLDSVAAAIDVIEVRIRSAVPIARVIYIEPDVDREARTSGLTTEAIVLPSSD